MGGRIPKSAQKAIDKANQQRRLFQATRVAAAAAIPVPRRMDGTTPRNICNLFDVYFNHELQLLCVSADVDSGTIERYVEGFGNRPKKGSAIEKLQGLVEIRRKVL